MGTSSTKEEAADVIVDKSVIENDQSWSVINLHIGSYLGGVISIVIILAVVVGMIFCLNSIRKKWLNKKYRHKNKFTRTRSTPLSLELPNLQIQANLDSTCRTVTQNNQPPLQLPLMYHNNENNMRSITSTDQSSQVP